jgi:hypothetical protein
MPYAWIDPDPVLTYHDVTIYYLYQDDFYENPVREFWYGFFSTCADEIDSGSFDIRDVVALLPPETRAVCEHDHQSILKALIDAGVLDPNGFLINGCRCDTATSIRDAVEHYLDMQRKQHSD